MLNFGPSWLPSMVQIINTLSLFPDFKSHFFMERQKTNPAHHPLHRPLLRSKMPSQVMPPLILIFHLIVTNASIIAQETRLL